VAIEQALGETKREEDDARDPKPGPPPAGEWGCLLHTVPEAARRLGRSVGTTYELLRAGEIPAFRLGSRWTIPRSTFDAWLNSRAKTEVG